MKLITYSTNGREAVGVLSADEKNVYPLESLGLSDRDMLSFIQNGGQEKVHFLQEKTASHPESSLPLEQVELLSPIPVPAQDIVCLGINFWAHAEESARYKKEVFDRNRTDAIYFSKRVNRAVPNGGAIDGHFDLVDSLDYEAELAVILGKDAKNVTKENAFDYVFGYTILNDISARNIQSAHKQWYFGKSLDDFTPMGPWIVTADEFAVPPVLSIQSRVNGELRQDSTTALFITGIAEVIAELSAGITLKAGTIISMGTPAGVGMGFTPPKFLKSGDVVECRIEGIGTLTNTVK